MALSDEVEVGDLLVYSDECVILIVIDINETSTSIIKLDKSYIDDLKYKDMRFKIIHLPPDEFNGKYMDYRIVGNVLDAVARTINKYLTDGSI